MLPRLFVFDMVGTTVKPSDAIPEAFRRALAGAGVKLADDAIQAVRGRSKRRAIAELLPAPAESADCARVYADFKSRLEAQYREGGAEAIHGAEECFSWCRSVGSKVVLTTGFDRDIATLLLECLGWRENTDGMICSDDVPEGRPAPFLIQQAMAQTGILDSVANVGDTVSDLESANNASVRWNFGVLSGAHDATRLRQVPDAIIIPDVAALPGYDWPGDG